ncbi:MAG: hypothetical protein EZS28_034396, partial [Streblomastix strix]
MMSYKQR